MNTGQVFAGFCAAALYPVGLCSAQGILYAVHHGGPVDSLVSFDTQSLERMVVGPFGVPANSGELAWDPERRVMYLVDGSSSDGRDALYTVDLKTGAATLVGVHGVEFLLGLEWDPWAERLYATVGARGTGFYEVDPLTALATYIGDPRQPFQTLAYDIKRDRMLAAISFISEFYEVNRATGEAELLAGSKFFSDCGMKYDRDRDVLWMIDFDGNIFRYALPDFSREELASGLGQHDGMVYVPDFVTLTIAGECPGRITAEVTEATPGGFVAIAYAFGEDNRPLPDGRPCAGTWIRLDETARLIGVVRADANGRATLTRNAPPAACGGRVFLQAIDIDACATTDVEVLL